MIGLVGRLVRAGVGILVSVACLAFIASEVDLAQTLAVLGTANLVLVVVAVAAIVADVLLRARRWQVLLAPVHRVGYRPVLSYLLIGYLANNVLPARLGELVRAHYLGDREGISRTTAFGTILVERVIDTAVLAAIAALAIVVLHVRGAVANAALFGLALAGLLTLALAFAVAVHLLPGADRVAAFVRRWPRLHELIRKLRGGLAVAARPATVVHAVLLSLAGWGVGVFAFVATAQALGIGLTMGQAALLMAGVNLATAIPSGPGYLGPFELAAVRIAAVFGIAPDPALALALLVHFVILAVTSVAGAIALVPVTWKAERRVGAHESGTVAQR